MAKISIEEMVLKNLFEDMVSIIGEIKQPKGDRVAPRIYISTQHLDPKGELELNKKYKILFLPIKEKDKET